MHLSTQQAHLVYVEGLAFGIFLAHEHFAFHVHQRRCCSRGNTVLTCARFSNNARFTHLLGKQNLPEHVAAETEEAAEKALGRIKVTYNVLEPVLDFRAAKDNPILVHPEDNWHMLCDLGGDNTRNLVGGTADSDGDVEAVLADCDIVLERTYHTKAYNQAMMETCIHDAKEIIQDQVDVDLLLYISRAIESAQYFD